MLATIGAAGLIMLVIGWLLSGGARRDGRFSTGWKNNEPPGPLSMGATAIGGVLLLVWLGCAVMCDAGSPPAQIATPDLSTIVDMTTAPADLTTQPRHRTRRRSEKHEATEPHVRVYDDGDGVLAPDLPRAAPLDPYR
jgi:hypothetical protein